MSYMSEANAIAAALRGQGAARAQRHARAAVPLRRKVSCISDAQRDVLAYMRVFFADNDQLPPVQAVATRFGWTVGGAAWHVNALVRLGKLERNAVGKLRFARPEQGGAL